MSNRTPHFHQRLSRLLVAAAMALAAAQSIGGMPSPLKNVADIETALRDPSCIGQPFDIAGDIVEYARGVSNEWNVIVRAGGYDLFVKDKSTAPQSGAKTGPDSYSYLDRVRFIGRIFEGDNPGDAQLLGYLRAVRLASGNTDNVPEIALSEMTEHSSLGRLVHIRGIVRSTARDESDPNFVHLLLRSDTSDAHVFIHITALTPFDPTLYLGAEVRACGVCRNHNDNGLRRHIGHVLAVSGLENVQVTRPPMSFANAPGIGTLYNTTPRQIANSGFVSVQGAVLAVWGKNSIMLKAEDGRLVRVHLQRPDFPAFGEQIVALGLPVTDFYSIDLIHARWRQSGLPRKRPDKAAESTPRNMQIEYKGKPQLMVRQQGKAVRFTGVVRYLPERDASDRLVQIEADGLLTPVDVSAHPQLLDRL